MRLPRPVPSERRVLRGMFEAVVRQRVSSARVKTWVGPAQGGQHVNPACAKEQVRAMNSVVLVRCTSPVLDQYWSQHNKPKTISLV